MFWFILLLTLSIVPGILQVDGSTRESVCEVLFEQDLDCLSVSTMVLDALLACPLDTRRHLAKNLVITGGMSMIMGFKARLFEEIKYLLQVIIMSTNVGLAIMLWPV